MGKLFCVVVKINLQARGVQPTHQPAKANPTQPNPTQLADLGRFLGVGGLGWVMQIFLIVGRVRFRS